MYSSRFADLCLSWLLAALALLAGCGGSNPAGNGDQNGGGLALLSTRDQQALARAAQEYQTLAAAGDHPAARAALVQSLDGGTTGVKRAVLFADGYSVFIEFDGGAVGVLNTADLAALNAGVDTLDLAAAGKPLGAVRPRLAKLSPDAHVPASRKVLFLNPSAVDMPGSSDVIAAAVTVLKNQGWTDADIVVKTRTTRTSTAITPDDFLNLHEYGVVVIFARGLFGSPAGDSQLYVQCCSAVDYAGAASADRIEQWNAWIASGELVPAAAPGSGDTCYYLRQSVFAHSQSVPNSLVYLVCPYGWHLGQTFENKGCGNLLGWDAAMRCADAYSSFLTFFKGIASSVPARSDAEAFSAPAVRKVSANPDGGTASLRIYLADSGLYLPAWAHVVIDPGSLPAATVRKGLGTTYKERVAAGTQAPSVSFDVATHSGDLDGLVPVLAQFEGSAADANGNVIASVIMARQLHVGENHLAVDFSRQHVAGEVFRIDTHHPDGRVSTALYSVFKFTANPESNRYKIFTDDYPDGLEVRQPLTTSGLWFRGDWCYSTEQIASILGSDPFDVPVGQVANVYFSHFGNYRPDGERDFDPATGTRTTWAEYIEQVQVQTELRVQDYMFEVIFQ